MAAASVSPPGTTSSPSWHPSLTSSSSSSSSLSSLGGYHEASPEDNDDHDHRSSSTSAFWIRRVTMYLLGKSNDNGEEEEEDEEDQRRRTERRRQRAARIVAGGSATILAAWMLMAYRRRRRLRRRKDALLTCSAAAAAATAATASVAATTATLAPSTSSSIIPYTSRDALESPLSLLLHHAKKGQILRAMMNKTGVAYQLATNTDSSTSNNNGNNSKWRRSVIPPTDGMAAAVTAALSEGGCNDISTLPEPLWERLLPIAIGAVPFLYLGLAYKMIKNANGGGGEMDTTDVSNGDGKDAKVTFADVAGVDVAKAELYEVVQYLSNPAPYRRLGASPPRGVLLHGPPGVGKTLLARAVAGEAKADYFVSCSGSDFVELFVGQGAKRVRELFRSVRDAARGRHRRQIARARFGAWWSSWVGRYLGIVDGKIIALPSSSSSTTMDCLEDRPPTAVIFIDEIDALAKCRDGIGRGTFIGGGNDEREQTLNALLTEMDGFGSPRDGGPACGTGGRCWSRGQAAGATAEEDVVVIVIAATNRRAVLDPALLRPGRFDRHVILQNPDRDGREAILRVHARRVQLDGKDSGGNLLLSELADEPFTGGFSGADLRNVINEAALLSVRAGRRSVGWNQLMEAARRVQQMKEH